MRSLTAAALLLAAQATAQVRITGIENSGPLCPPGTWATTIVESGDAVTIGFDAFYIEADENSEAIKGPCNVAVALTYPPGCTKADFLTVPGAFLTGDPPTTVTLSGKYKWATQRGSSEDTVVNDGVGINFEGMVWLGSSDMDGSLAVNEEGERSVVFEMEFNLHAEVGVGVGSSSGGAMIENITFNVTDVVTDSDWENCSL